MIEAPAFAAEAGEVPAFGVETDQVFGAVKTGMENPLFADEIGNQFIFRELKGRVGLIGRGQGMVGATDLANQGPVADQTGVSQLMLDAGAAYRVSAVREDSG
jgi:hypothetical protein